MQSLNIERFKQRIDKQTVTYGKLKYSQYCTECTREKAGHALYHRAKGISTRLCDSCYNVALNGVYGLAKQIAKPEATEAPEKPLKPVKTIQRESYVQRA